MSEQELFEKNLVLTTEFDRYLLEHPEIAEQIPSSKQKQVVPLRRQSSREIPACKQ